MNCRTRQFPNTFDARHIGPPLPSVTFAANTPVTDQFELDVAEGPDGTANPLAIVPASRTPTQTHRTLQEATGRVDTCGDFVERYNSWKELRPIGGIGVAAPGEDDASDECRHPESDEYNSKHPAGQEQACADQYRGSHVEYRCRVHIHLQGIDGQKRVGQRFELG